MRGVLDNEFSKLPLPSQQNLILAARISITMDSKILQSVVEITKQRDLDSLEYSLVATMAELVPVTEISILKIIHENNLDKLDEVVSLTVLPNESDDKTYVWSDTSQIVSIDQEIKDCLQSTGVSTYHTNGSFTRLLAPIICDGKTIGALIIKSTEDIGSFKTLIDGFVRIYNNYIFIFNESERDKLTGLYNRRTFDNKLQRLFQAQKIHKQRCIASGQIKERRKIPPDAFVWMIIFDIDHFKRVNDEYGHVFGDEVILTLSQIMKKCFRSSDLKFRIGGEEFVIILEPAPFETAFEHLERLRKTIAEHEFSQIGTVTISIGFAKITDKDYPPAILERADKALYYAKENGRNCVYNYEALIEEGKLTPPKKGGSVDIF